MRRATIVVQRRFNATGIARRDLRETKPITFKPTLLAAVAFAATPVLAQTAPSAPPARGNSVPDTRAEVEAQLRARLGAMDTNKDGTVTIEEARAYGATRAKADADEEFAGMDTDRNGQVSRAEFDAYHAKSAGRGMGGMGMGRMSAMGMGARGMGGREMMMSMRGGGGMVINDTVTDALQRFDATDANHDGRVTPDERRIMRERLDAARNSDGRGSSGRGRSAQQPQQDQ